MKVPVVRTTAGADKCVSPAARTTTPVTRPASTNQTLHAPRDYFDFGAVRRRSAAGLPRRTHAYRTRARGP